MTPKNYNMKINTAGWPGKWKKLSMLFFINLIVSWSFAQVNITGQGYRQKWGSSFRSFSRNQKYHVWHSYRC